LAMDALATDYKTTEHNSKRTMDAVLV